MSDTNSGTGQPSGPPLMQPADPTRPMSVPDPELMTAGAGPRDVAARRLAHVGESGQIPLRRGNPIGRTLRAAAGVDEEVLSGCWSDRHRYSGLGGIVIGTGVFAAVSMGFALIDTTSGGSTIPLVLAGLWGLFIFNLDRWLVASTHGIKSRWWSLLPRLLLAFGIGFVVAEPLVLRVFDQAIETRISADRREEVETLEATLAGCNPTSDQPNVVVPPNCGELSLNVSPPTDTSQQIALLGAKRAEAGAAVAALDVERTTTQDRLQRERLGGGAEAGDDVTGNAGIGPIAEALQVELDGIDQRLAERRAELVAIDRELGALTTAAAAGNQQRDSQIEAEIARRVEERRVEYAATNPGLLERIETLGTLTSENRELAVSRWFLTLFFVAVDAMPVLLKLMSSKSSYDRLLSVHTDEVESRYGTRATSSKADHEDQLRLRKFELEHADRLARRTIEAGTATRLAELDDRMPTTAEHMGFSPIAVPDTIPQESWR